jgi:Cu(I)/Ag(I) efflux system membrane fusion protein
MSTYQILSVILFLQLILLNACTSNDQSKSATQNQTTDENSSLKPVQITPSHKVPKNFGNQLDQVTKAYLATKDALVASDVQQVNEKIGKFIADLQQADSTALTTEAESQWLEYKQKLQKSATALQAAAKLEEKRAQFEDLSQTMYALVNTFGAKTTLYKAYCPMALNDKGAYWLSAQHEIKNPYFGDAMLECGEVQEVLQFKQ